VWPSAASTFEPSRARRPHRSQRGFGLGLGDADQSAAKEPSHRVGKTPVDESKTPIQAAQLICRNQCRPCAPHIRDDGGRPWRHLEWPCTRNCLSPTTEANPAPLH